MAGDDDEASYNGPPIAYKAEGDRFRLQADFTKAIKYYTKSVDADAGDSKALIMRSRCLERLGNIPQSLHDVDKVLTESPTNVKAILQKAESLYSNGDFEMALVYYHRGEHIKPSMKAFSDGIHRCLESINNTCGDSKAYLTLNGDLTFFQKNIEAERAARSAALSKFKAAEGSLKFKREATKEAAKAVPKFMKTERVRALLGRLYGDRQYLDKLLRTIDRNTVYGARVFEDAYEATIYLDQQMELWRTEYVSQVRIPGTKPRSVKELKDKANQMVVVELQRISHDQANGRYEESLERAQVLLETVENYRAGIIHQREEVYAKLQCYIGNAYLELGDPVKALDHFKMQKALSDQYHLHEIKSEALDNIGRAYAKMGEYKKALNIWHIRLPLMKTPLERACLYHEMGRCHYKLENYRRARDLGDKSFTAATEANDIMWQLSASVLIAQSHLQAGSLRRALNMFVQAMSYAEKGDYQKTMKALQSIINCIEKKIDELKAEHEEEEDLVEFRDTGMMTEPPEPDEKLSELKEVDKSAALPRRSQALRTDQAYVTLATNDIYAMGALVLSASLLQSGTDRTLVVMVTPGISPAMRSLLDARFDLVFDVTIIDSRDYDNLALLERAELGVTFTKIHCWRLLQFNKGVFMDADTMVLQNVDDLFKRKELSAAPDAGWPDCFNSGVFVFKPSLETFNSLLDFALKFGSFDGGDQGLLNQYFDKWATEDIDKHLPFTYNLVSQAFYSYLPAYKAFGHQAKIVHFIGPDKPWSFDYNFVSCRAEFVIPTIQSQELIQIWWEFFMSFVQKYLTDEMQGLVAQLSKMRLRAVATETDDQFDRQRLQNWERNEIDYMGRDAFENIQKRLDQAISVDIPSEVKEVKDVEEVEEVKDVEEVEEVEEVKDVEEVEEVRDEEVSEVGDDSQVEDDEIDNSATGDDDGYDADDGNDYDDADEPSVNDEPDQMNVLTHDDNDDDDTFTDASVPEDKELEATESQPSQLLSDNESQQ